MPRRIPEFSLPEALVPYGMTLDDKSPHGVIVHQHDPYFEDYEYGGFPVDSFGNADLPVFSFREKIVQSVRDNPVTIIVAETGAGKSTQVPQFLAEDGYKRVHITQPRRPAARNVFLRVRDEISQVRGWFAGEDIASYQTAGEREGPEDAVIRVVTDGLQLVHELHDKGAMENEVLIIDEAHEWNSNVEVLVAWTKKALIENPELRVVVMSATMDANHLAEYYDDACDVAPPIINIPGRLHKVERAIKPHSTVVEEVARIALSMADERGSLLSEGSHGILAFLPGKREINDAIVEVGNRLPKKIERISKILPLHAKLSQVEQQRAMTEYPGTIKIVFATDVAQTSLTIPDITHVVDSGFQRRLEVDQEGTKGLMLRAISLADINQRAGRTGRVSDGNYILTRLNETTPHTPLEERDNYPVPEILRTDIARSTLRLAALGLDISEFDMYHKASNHSIEIAKRNLRIIGAFDDNDQITELGKKMNNYPLSASSARIMVEAERYSEKTRAYAAAITAAKEMNGLQYFAYNVGKRWLELTEDESSDLLVQLDLFISIQEMTEEEIVQYDLDLNNIKRAREQFLKIARIAGTNATYLTPPSEQEREDVRRCIAAGYMHSVYFRDDNTYSHGLYKGFNKRELSNRSVVANEGANIVVGDPYNVEMLDGEAVMLRRCIENVTTVTARLLGSVATSKQVEWRLDDYQIRDGKAMQRERQVLLGSIDLGIVQEVPAVPSERLRDEIISYALEHPGKEQKKLRKIKSDLEKYDNLSKSRIPMLTHDMIVQLVKAAAPTDITTPATIEDNLRVMLLDPEHKLGIDDFISPEKRKEILHNAPDLIDIEGILLRVNYRKGKPVVSRYNKHKICELKSSIIMLEDGREVFFRYAPKNGRGKDLQLHELQYLLANE